MNKWTLLAFVLWVVAATAYMALTFHWGWVIPLSFFIGSVGDKLGTIWGRQVGPRLREWHMRRVVRRMMRQHSGKGIA